MKITDKAMAKALGWKFQPKSTQGESGFPWYNPSIKMWQVGLPKFTTSLDTIVAEIKARGLVWIIGDGTAYGPLAKVYAKKSWAKVKGYRAKTAELALCAALLAFIKDNKR